MQYDAADEQTFQLQALEIRDIDGQFDPKRPPQNGEEFLLHMLHERKRCPAVVTKQPRAGKTVNNPINNGLTLVDSPALPPHKCLLPTPEWQKAQAQIFKKARKRITAMRLELQVQEYDQSLEPPLTSDIEKWQQFCREQQPLLSTLLRLSQIDLEHLLEMQKNWLNNEPSLTDGPSTSAAAAANGTTTLDLYNKDAWLARWLYATLVCLHLPLEPHVFSTLRCIARACVVIRNQLQPEEVQRAAPYNLIVTIIALVFAQMDFAIYL